MGGIQRWFIIGVVLVLTGIPGEIHGRQNGSRDPVPPPAAGAQSDSLRALLLQLQARLDSLETVLTELQGGPGRPVAPGPGRHAGDRRGGPPGGAVDELAALRAAARARVAEAPPPDTTPRTSVLKSRNLNDFNPEISVSGDVRIVGHEPGPQENNIDIREFAVQFQAPLDPFSQAVFSFSAGEEGFSFEEGYAYWTSLPLGLRVDAGRFRQQIGELNRWHLHAQPETEYPLVLREYFGDDGLVGDGLSIYGTLPFQSPGGGVHEFWGQVTRAGNEVLFEEGNRLSYLGHILNFWQLTDATYFQIGASALWGENPESDLEATVLATDFRLSWVPPGRALHNSFTIRGEVFAVDRTHFGVNDDYLGGYLSTTFNTSQKWNMGGRFDYVEPLSLPGEHIWAIVPQITWWQSEWVFLRGEWGLQSVPTADGDRDTSSVFGLQVVWSLGPHKHANY